MHDYLIVGCGFFGAVVAERLANEGNASVLVIDKRDHLGGNSHSAPDPKTGIEWHTYGTHIFHTSNERVWNYISGFMELNAYHHQVLTIHKGRVYQMPINLETINDFYGTAMRPFEAEAFIRAEAAKAKIRFPANMEEKTVSLIGRPLYEAFIRNYTIKQWGTDPKELPASIIKRLPVRFNYNEDYFHNCKWQGIPVDGYNAVFERLLASENIDVRLGVDYLDRRDELVPRKAVVYTGALDRLYGYRLGKLPWREVRFARFAKDVGDHQGTAVMNYSDLDVPHTRIHEPRHLHPERDYPSEMTVCYAETSHAATSEDAPSYPIANEANQRLQAAYLELAEADGIVAGGRLGHYTYYDMDAAIDAALTCADELAGR